MASKLRDFCSMGKKFCNDLFDFVFEEDKVGLFGERPIERVSS